MGPRKIGAIRKAILVGSAVVALGLPHAAFAQDEAGEETEATEDGDIVVTARKREESVQTVPIAITAYAAETLAAQNISNFNDLSNSTPGINVTSIAGGTTQQIFVRGLAPANTTTDLNVEANVGTFIDGIYQTSRNTLDMISVLDVGQIEIAKGPQSALFGRSTFAGALSIHTQRPSDELSGSISATAGEDKDFRIKGTVTGPLSDTISARIAAGYLTYDGWGKNSAAPDDKLGGTKKYAVNAALEFKPSENFTARLSGFLTDSRTEMTPVSHVPLTSFNCGTTSTAAVTLNLRQQVCGGLVARKVSDISPNIPVTKSKSHQISLDLEASLSGVKIVSITGFTEAKNRAHNDYDASSAGVLLGVCAAINCVPAGPYTRLVRTNLVTIGLERVKTFSQEIRLQSDNESPFQWLLGANFFDQKIPLAAGGVGADRAGLAANERFMQIT
jgi:iron complex outermembrane recepter protein